MDSLMNNLFTTNLTNQKFPKYKSLDKKIKSVANFFGFSSLPEEYKIKIFFCNTEKMEFWKIKNKVSLPKFAQAYTISGNQIFILEYDCLKSKYSQNDYIAMIIHECVHVFQGYFSYISPIKYIWLYESVACFLAGQSNVSNQKDFEEWDVFISSFYSIKNCYGIAYNFGKKLIETNSRDFVLEILRNPIKHISYLKNLYNKP